MTVLITGATGKVGSRLLPRLRQEGVSCRALVRRPLQMEADCVEGDLLDPSSLAAAVQGTSAIIHLAAVLRAPDPDAIRRANLEGTRNLIEAALSFSPEARFIMASTGLVYSEQAQRPSREEDIVDPRRAYPSSKSAAEKLLMDSALNWSILRFGFVYGDGDGHLSAIPRLAQAFEWHPANRLSLVHHRDVATASMLALHGAFDRRIVNIVDDAPTTVYELAAIASAPLDPSPAAVGNPWAGHLDGGLARKLGFQPLVRTVHQAIHERTL